MRVTLTGQPVLLSSESPYRAAQGCVGLHRLRERGTLQYDTLASSTCRFFLLMVLDGCSSSFHHGHIPASRNGEEEKLKGRTCLFLLKPQQRSSTQTYCSHVIGQNLVKQPSSPWESRNWSLLARKPSSGVNLRNSITNEGGKQILEDTSIL